MLLAIVDAARVQSLRRSLHEGGAPGHTELPVVEGAGRTGLHTGDRVHPGALVAVFAVVEDTAAAALFEKLTNERDAAADRVTRFFVLPVERQA